MSLLGSLYTADLARPTLRFQRNTLRLVALGLVLLAFGQQSIPWLPWPALWGTMFVAGAVADLAASFRFKVRVLQHATMLTGVALASRGAVLVYAELVGLRDFTAGELVTGLTVWFGLTALIGLVFIRGLTVAAAWLERGG